MRQHAVSLVLGVALALVTSDCGNSPTGPTPGNLAVALAGAGPADHALLVEVAGADSSARIDTVVAAAASSYRVFAGRVTATRWRVIVAGALANGPLVQIGVPDTRKAPAYSGVVLDVANAVFAELVPGGRSLTVSR